MIKLETENSQTILKSKKLAKTHDNIKQRTTNPNHNCYQYYGGRGITMCDEWLNSVDAFVAYGLTHGYEIGLDIDRIDNDKGYCPENVRFVTHSQNCRNKGQNVYVDFQGKNWLLVELCESYKMPYNVVKNRLRVGWTLEKAMTKPVGRKGWQPKEVGETGIFVEAFGETKNVAQWAKDTRCVVNYSTLRARIKDGMTPELALTTPARRMMLTLNSETHSLQEWSYILHVSTNTLKYRLDKGLPLEKVLAPKVGA